MGCGEHAATPASGRDERADVVEGRSGVPAPGKIPETGMITELPLMDWLGLRRGGHDGAGLRSGGRLALRIYGRPINGAHLSLAAAAVLCLRRVLRARIASPPRSPRVAALFTSLTFGPSAPGRGSPASRQPGGDAGARRYALVAPLPHHTSELLDACYRREFEGGPFALSVRQRRGRMNRHEHGSKD